MNILINNPTKKEFLGMSNMIWRTQPSTVINGHYTFVDNFTTYNTSSVNGKLENLKLVYKMSIDGYENINPYDLNSLRKN
jgi:hypothetical protein